MTHARPFIFAFTLLLLISSTALLLRAQDTGKPAELQAPAPINFDLDPAGPAPDLTTPPRVYSDFAKITNLTPEQRDAIHKIQRQAREKIAKIEDDAEKEAKALLTPDQLAQLQQLDKERKLKAKKAYEERKKKEREDQLDLARRRKADTQPQSLPNVEISQ